MNETTGRDHPPRKVWILGAACAGLALGVLAAMLALGPQQREFAFLYDHFTIDTCLAENGVTDLLPSQQDREVIACYNKLVRQGELNEFQIRRINFVNQHIANGVTLWMVVTLTLCGVGLSAWQILSSSKLVQTNPEALTSEVRIESGKLFVRSSVTGLLIMIVSFAFFYVYVVFVYQIDEWEDGQSSASSAASSEPAPQPAPQPTTEGRPVIDVDPDEIEFKPPD